MADTWLLKYILALHSKKQTSLSPPSLTSFSLSSLSLYLFCVLISEPAQKFAFLFVSLVPPSSSPRLCIERGGSSFSLYLHLYSLSKLIAGFPLFLIADALTLAYRSRTRNSGLEMERPSPPLLSDNEHGESPTWRSLKNRPATGAGLENLGNTCFLNAILQCLSHTVPLLESLPSTPHSCICGGNTGYILGETRFCSICALRQHIDVCVHQGATIVKPLGFVANLSNISSSFTRYQQEDAHEFLNCLLDHLHNCCLNCFQVDNNGTQTPNKSLVHSIFGGRLRSQVHCCDCGHRSDTYEPFLDLSLEIQAAETLEQALRSFTQVETIDDPQVKLTCDGCHSRVSVNKQLTLECTPPIIAFHLKRFDANGYFGGKIDKFVKFPKKLDLRPFLSDPGSTRDVKYELYAAVMHQGSSALQGHYNCFVRPAPDSWFIMDDEKVYKVDEEEALSQGAYMLFYMKRGVPWFSSFLEPAKMSRKTSPASVLDHPREMVERENAGEECFPGKRENEEKPSTPEQSNFYDEPWEEGQKRCINREMAAVGSCLRTMPKARRQRLEELMGLPSANEGKKKKQKMLLDPSLLHDLINGQDFSP